jgi:hypothetical protein
MTEKLSARIPPFLIMALEEFSDAINARNMQDHITKMIFAFLQADEEAAQYDYSKELWGEFDALFSLLAVIEDFQIGERLSGEEHA